MVRTPTDTDCQEPDRSAVEWAPIALRGKAFRARRHATSRLNGIYASFARWSLNMALVGFRVMGRAEGILAGLAGDNPLKHEPN